jgi:preprotein translocase subunit SecG
MITLLVLIVLVAVLLIITIMVQNPKGGGLDSSFSGGSSQMIGGVKQTGDFLEKSTWFLSALLVILVLGTNVILSRGDSTMPRATKANVEVPAATPSTGDLDNAPQTPIK